MEMDTLKTKVIFRVFKEGDVIALFPSELADNRGNCMSYMHIGQHGAADYNGLVRTTRLATEAEYKALARELTSIGYNLEIRTRK